MFLLAAVGFGSIACGDDPKSTDDPIGPPNPGDYDITVTAKSALGDYYSTSRVKDGSTEFILVLSNALLTGGAMDPEIGGAGRLVFLDLYAQMSAARKGILPDGTYKFIGEGVEPSIRTCSAANTFIMSADQSGQPEEGSGLDVKSGSVVVTSSGTNYTITVDFVLTNNKTFSCTYTGPITFVEQDYVISTLTADYVVPVAPYPATFVWVPDGYKIGADVWIIQMLPKIPGMSDDGMQFELACPKGKFADGIPLGTYTVGIPETYNGELCINPGWIIDEGAQAGNLSGTWYIGGFGSEGLTRLAPATSGTATVSKDGDKYTVEFEFLDDAVKPHTFSGTWTGVPTMIDNTAPQAGNAPAKNSFKAARANKVRTLL